MLVLSIVGAYNFRVLGRDLAEFHSVNLNEIEPVGRDGPNTSQAGEVVWSRQLCEQMDAFSNKLSDAELYKRLVVLRLSWNSICVACLEA